MFPLYMQTTKPWKPYRDDDDDDDGIAYFTVRWKTRELVLSTAPKTWDNTDKEGKNRKRSHSPRKSVRGGHGKRSMGEKIDQKGKL